MDNGNRTCPGCGGMMENPHPNRKYCSQACSNWVRAGHLDLRETRTECLRCGKKFDRLRAGKKYCGKTCKSEAAHERADGHYSRRYVRERERRLQAAKKYAQEHPEVGQAAKRRRKALLAKNGVHRFSGADWKRCLDRHGHRCVYCGASGQLTMDHVVPVTRGGTHGAGNIVPACNRCNASKGNSLLVEWRARGGRLTV